MATNEILQFAGTDTGTNLLTQAEYLADSQRPIGNQPGIARSKLVNKALRQASLISSGVAEFIADNQANNITDSLTPQNIADYMAAVVRSLGIPTAIAGGTSEAITGNFTPDIVLTNGATVIVRAGSANTTITPTFAADGLAAKTIVKGNNLALSAGDIAGAGHWLEMNFDSVLDKWVLLNPANGVVQSLEIASTGEAQAGTNNTKAITPLRMREGLNASGLAPVYAPRAWVNFNGQGVVSIRASGNVSSITDRGVGLYTINMTTGMQDVNYAPFFSSANAANNSWAAREDIAVARTTTAVGMTVSDAGLPFDPLFASVVIFR